MVERAEVRLLEDRRRDVPLVAAHSAAAANVATVAVVPGSRYEDMAKTPSIGLDAAPPPHAPPFSRSSLCKNSVLIAWPSRNRGAASSCAYGTVANDAAR